ncbi:hypothetical protein TIFTF001_021077 [Ficus carica]|uniref:DUF668 family protein n=1 Tax=Ficus carica TaxID=3494 RepID=A0AA88DAE6_FICCA|nr:hypothetical protein TIFTF001_021077 [Ficus carica]
MGGICSRTRRSSSIGNVNVNNAPSESYPHSNGHLGNGSYALPMKADSNSMPSSAGNSMDMQLRDPFSFQEVNVVPYGLGSDDTNDGIPRLSRALSNKSRSTKSKQAAVAKVSEVSSLLGRAGTAGLGKAVEVLDTLGSSLTNLNLSSGFTAGVTTKGNKISILAFEVANTIVKGSNLMESLSKDNIKRLKEEVLISEGVQNLVSRDMDELLRIAASDKRDELKIFSGEVVGFRTCPTETIEGRRRDTDATIDDLGSVYSFKIEEFVLCWSLDEKKVVIWLIYVCLLSLLFPSHVTGQEIREDLEAEGLPMRWEREGGFGDTRQAWDKNYLGILQARYRVRDKIGAVFLACEQGWFWTLFDIAMHKENSVAGCRRGSFQIWHFSRGLCLSLLGNQYEIILWLWKTSEKRFLELYHELHALDRFEQDYRRKHQEEDTSNPTQRGDSLAILRAELKSQRKHVRNLKKKSLWSKILEEIMEKRYLIPYLQVMEKLVDKVHFLHVEISEAFGSADGDKPIKGSHNKLGSAGLALHYANIITQIDTLVSRSSSVPPNTRDALYQGLPPTIKSALRSKLQSFQVKEELTIPQIKIEMEKTLRWLVPIANNTTKAHHGFGWVGEWANTGSDVNRKPAGQTDLLRIETLHHADKEKTEAYILELVVWLHHLVSQARAGNGGVRSPIKSPIRSPNQKTVQLSSCKPNCPSPMLTVEDQEMLRDVSKRKLTPGISKSQEFDTVKTRLSKHHRLSKSSSHSPTSETRKDPFPIRRPSSVPVINFDIDRIKALDVIDRVDNIRSN